MHYNIKKFEKEYGKKSINECVTLAKKWDKELIQRGEQLIGLLWYLEKTKRYHEMEGYKKLGFDVFIDEICNIRYNRYRQLAYAYNWYPKECYEFGPQTIQSILEKKISRAEIPQVIAEIKGSVAKVKSPEKRRIAINQVIEKHMPPKKETSGEDTKAYWRQKAVELEAIIRKKDKIIAELQAQLDRQKPRIEALNTLKEQLQPVFQA